MSNENVLLFLYEKIFPSQKSKDYLIISIGGA